MNREFKFRAWDKETKRMFNIYGLGKDWCTEDTFDGVDPDTNCFDGDEFKERIVVMQYIGLFGKEKNIIYDGDIVKVRGTKKVGEYVTVVEFSRQGHTLQKNLTYYNDDSCFLAIIEVIGNIYENPELLNDNA